MKKGISVVLSLFMILGLVSCGNSVSTLNENDLGESPEEFDEIIDKVESDMEAEEETTATVNKEEESEATAIPTQSPVSTPAPTAEFSPEPTVTPEPTPTPHTHKYTETVTRQATCSTAGERKLTCECGESKTETVPATGNHNWEPVYQTINHPSVGHVEQVQVGTSEGSTEYACGVCDARFDTPSGVVDHCASFVSTDRTHATARTIMYDYPGTPIYESQWIVDTPETTTQELVGYTCSICGVTQ